MRIQKKKDFSKLLIIVSSFLFLFIYCELITATDDLSYNDLPLPSPSTLPQEDIEKAISFFESQHESWLTIRSGTAKYASSTQKILKGECFDDPNHIYSGTLEFLVRPLNNPTKLQSPVKVEARLFNDLYKVNRLRENVFDMKSPFYTWAESSPLTGEQSKKMSKHGFRLELFFFPLDFMAKTYKDGIWDNKYAEVKEEFFAGRGIPRRLSTEAETQNIFGGEQQYLFMLSPALTDAHYWFSSENGELRQIDVFLPGNIVKSFRYENYVKKADSKAKYPQKFILSYKDGEGEKMHGWIYTVELSDLKINIDISSQRFVPSTN